MVVVLAAIAVAALAGGVHPKASGQPSAAGAPPAAAQVRPNPTLPTVADASPGTVFETHYSVGGGRQPVGLVKRGRSDGRLFNPSTDSVALRAGDTLVSRGGQFYRVETGQRLPGGTGAVGPGAVVYQGEQDLVFVGFGTGWLAGTEQTGELALDLNGSVPADQPPGRYLDPTNRTRGLTVQRPRVSNLRVFSQGGGVVRPNGTVKADEFVVVAADVNFLEAARVRIGLVDSVTGERVTRGVLSRRGALVRFPQQEPLISRLVPDGQGTAVGADPALRSLANPALAHSSTVFLVQDLRPVYPTGRRYDVVVEADPAGSFGDLAAAGASDRVQIYTDRTSQTDAVPLPPSDRPPYPTIQSPGQTYVVGDLVEVSGTADPRLDAVAVYARPADGTAPWELLSPSFSWVFVRVDGTWRVPNVRLSTESWTLRSPGQFRLGVVPAVAADRNGDRYPDQRLSLDAFDRAGGTSYPLSVVPKSTSTTTSTEPPTTTSRTPSPTPRPRPTETTTTTTTVEPDQTTSATTRQTTSRPTPNRPLDGFGGPVLVLALLALTLALLVRARRG